MLVQLLTLAVGFAVLTWSADRFVLGASGTAQCLGVPPLMIGLTVVGFGTSAPEMLVSSIAAWQGNAGIALGNALGSNITNVGLILGLTALLYPLEVRSRILHRELPLLLVVMAAVFLLVWDGALSRVDAIILLGGLTLMLAWMGVQAARGGDTADAMGLEFADEIPADMPLGRALLWLAIGLALLLASSRLLVWAAVDIATALGVSDLVIGLTVIALGTSLPELAASVASARKGEHDIAIGNVIGSNMFNLLGVLGLAGTIAPFRIDSVSVYRDYAVMSAVTILLFAMAYGVRGGSGRINRVEGTLLIVGYVAYQCFLAYTEL